MVTFLLTLIVSSHFGYAMSSILLALFHSHKCGFFSSPSAISSATLVVLINFCLSTVTFANDAMDEILTSTPFASQVPKKPTKPIVLEKSVLTDSEIPTEISDQNTTIIVSTEYRCMAETAGVSPNNTRKQNIYFSFVLFKAPARFNNQIIYGVGGKYVGYKSGRPLINSSKTPLPLTKEARESGYDEWFQLIVVEKKELPANSQYKMIHFDRMGARLSPSEKIPLPSGAAAAVSKLIIPKDSSSLATFEEAPEVPIVHAMGPAQCMISPINKATSLFEPALGIVHDPRADAEPDDVPDPIVELAPIPSADN
jgi:hypothetical protein